ncbi:LysR family transcriptional regulator ArgP [Nocardioides deserti]|uniref:LysR family transcriptional regulator ArgP n=1 Tax=Nocardioides deserti TaxID=1588644 RepID=A0ABR6U5M0_9ACTN|nr:LysR family transcriptional regulator ArgP [Nocardioides deserti]MBC2959730.1 LysR family transcriptional regulator ArgP [Nocardioides deserti]GGO74402.1 transcriptional regulator ArgP [Nocardioides deserti]
MHLDPAWLAALTAIADHGTFDAAARHLHLTPSAVSQRIRALESEVGQVVVRRTAPAEPTAAGEALLRLARQTTLLHEEALRELGGHEGGVARLPVAVNADSLATWFHDVLGAVADRGDAALQLHVLDQAWSADLLRAGTVLAAVTSDPVAVQGCSVEPLGTLRYAAAAAPSLAERFRRGRGVDWSALPVVVFDDKDALQHELLGGRGLGLPPVVHRVPTSADFLEAVRLGLGWGALPEPQLLPDLDAGRLVRLDARRHLDVPLHWQRWRLRSALLDTLSDDVRRAAGRVLR